MEEQLVHLLAETQSTAEGPRKQAEHALLSLYANPAFPLGLVSIASHDSVPLAIRQSALLSLKIFVLAGWSPTLDEFKGQILVSDEHKQQLRNALFELATSARDERKVKNVASYVVSKIAAADFPEEWPDLLPRLLHIIPVGNEGQVHGALRVLAELIEEGLHEDQFFQVARDIVKVVYDIAVNDSRRLTLRALAVSVLRGCFGLLEMVFETHRSAVKAFVDETLGTWMEFFLNILKAKLPNPPSIDEENAGGQVVETYRGMVALKLQVVKVLMKIRTVFPAALLSQSTVLFSAIWEELFSLQTSYHQLYIDDDRQGRLEDSDNLPYTLDFLVLEDLDFLATCLRAAPVKKQLEADLHAQAGAENTWVTEVMKLAVAYSQITNEEEGLWNIDVNVFLSEETSVTTNYTPRTACGDLVIKLADWIKGATVDGLLRYTRTLYASNQPWKAKESALYILNQIISDDVEAEHVISLEVATGFVDYLQHAMHEDPADDSGFLRARAYLTAGSLSRVAGEGFQQIAASFLQATLQTLNNETTEIVMVSCIRSLQFFLQALPHAITTPLQEPMVSTLTNFLQSQDLSESSDNEDLMLTLVETLRDIIMLDIRFCLTGSGLDLLLMIASHGAAHFQLSSMATEIFECVTEGVAGLGPEAYTQLCGKVLPSLMGAFDVGNLTEENSLTNLAAELLAILAEFGTEPLPNGIVATVMPKLNRLLLGSTDDELLKSCTLAVKNILSHDHEQMFAWRDETGKGGLEVLLVIIDRLLSPTMEDNAAAEIGSLAAEVVEKAGSERLGPYLMQLLRAVAIRLGSATQPQFIQSLTLVFARLSLVNAREVVDFLAQVQMGQETSLQVVVRKWLENSINFAGYDEIRQNVIALSKLYNLHDAGLAQVMVKGDMIMPQDGRIMTRSRARQNPDQWTIIPAPLKIIKLLVEELLSASGTALDYDADIIPSLISGSGIKPPVAGGSGEGSTASPTTVGADTTAADINNNVLDEDEDEWEDDPDMLDLDSAKQRRELMNIAQGLDMGNRQRDDETQQFLVGFFHEIGRQEGFNEVFGALTPAEQDKLRRNI